MKTKKCSKCGEERPISKYAKYSDGRYTGRICSSCQWKRQHSSHGRDTAILDKIHDQIMLDMMPIRTLTKSEIEQVAHLYQAPKGVGN